MNDVLLYIRNFAYSHDSTNVSAADRAKQYKTSKVFEDGGKLFCRSHRQNRSILYSAMCNTKPKKVFGKKWQK